MKHVTLSLLRLSLFLGMACLASYPGLAAVEYRFDLTTAYATSNPFPNRIDSAFTAADTGFILIVNAGPSDYRGIVRIVAVSPFAGDMGFNLPSGFIPSGGSVSIAMPNDSSDVGGFNGPAFFFRPGAIVYLEGIVSANGESAPVKVAAADLDIHSGVFRVDPNGLTTDNFVLQGGDPFGFDNGDAFELSQAWGHLSLTGVVGVPAPPVLPILGAALAWLVRSRHRVLAKQRG